ncbi:response regulator transcription factor [Paenibacillus sp. FSL K6-2524]|uniref:response regulator transcription factor n=1 Tax=Paenibacillus sp. FSL K6-2524 TaxID=2954516 RepID=UPI0030FAA558
MLTAILVDDDYPVLRYLSQTVTWDALDIELIGCYSNGLEAWEATQVSPPDIVITDIGMPKMNGLEMLEKLRSVNPNLRAVVLSCHNEFHFAQQALKLQVNDYILKESMDVVHLQQVLHKISVDLNLEKKASAEMLLYKRKESLNKSALKEKFLKDTLYQTSCKKELWIEQARIHGITVDALYYIPMVVSVDRLSDVTLSRKMNDYTIVFAVENILQEILTSNHRCEIFQHSNKELVVLFCCDEPDKEQQLLKYSAKQSISAIQQYLKISVSCFVGRETRNPEDLRKILLPMLKEPGHRFYLKESTVHRFEKATFAEVDMYTEYSRYYSAINDMLALNQPEELQATLSSWDEWVRTERFRPSDVKEWILQLLMELQMKTKLTLQYQPDISEEKLYDVVNSIERIDHLQQWISQYFKQIFRKMSLVAVHSKRAEIIKAQQYVIQHVTEKITLEEMASYLNLNSSYFSRLFKRETNYNFIEYVNMMKLQKAKELLQQSNKTVEDISDYLGYANKSYFIKLFKREIGMRPSEYSAWN